MNDLTLRLDRMTLVSLIGEGQAPILPRLFRHAHFAQDLQHVIEVPLHRLSSAQRALLAARIDAATERANRAVMLVAEGVGCLAAAWWARLSPPDYVGRVAGAVMIAPEAASGRHDGFASPDLPLPFPSIAVGADDVTQQLGSTWGSRLIDGPLTLSERGPSRRFASMMERFTAAVVQRDVAAAERILGVVGDH